MASSLWPGPEKLYLGPVLRGWLLKDQVTDTSLLNTQEKVTSVPVDTVVLLKEDSKATAV